MTRHHRKQSMVFIALLGLLTLALAAPSAYANFEWLGTPVGEFAAGGSGDVAVNSGCYYHERETGHVLSQGECEAFDPANGDVYVADTNGDRVTRFNAKGEFLGAWGWQVVANGPDKVGTDEVEAVTVKATGGKFILTYNTTAGGLELPFDASSKEVESELNGQASIKEKGGRVKVEGGPGDKTGSKPYIVTFEAGLGDEATLLISTKNNGAGPHGEPLEPLSGGEPLSSVEPEVVTPGVNFGGFQDCSIAAGDICRSGVEDKSVGQGEGVGQFHGLSLRSVAVDQATGDVYAMDEPHSTGARGMVQVFSASGAIVGSLGERAAGGSLISASPGLIHQTYFGGLAVDDSGRVYVLDNDGNGAESRVMVFEPETPGHFEHYVYAGQSHDLAVGFVSSQIAVDSSGTDLWVDQGAQRVYKFKIGEPDVPVCKFESNTDIEGLAVDDLTGGAFTYSNQTKRFHKLNADCEQVAEEGEFPGVKGDVETHGLAFNPGLVLAAGRPPGVLYAVDQALAKGFIFAEPPVFPPVVVSESVSSVGASFASPVAEVNSSGFDTRYHFEYGLEDTAGCGVSVACGEAPLGGGDLGSLNEAVAASVTLTGLQPDTEYHYRVVASNHCHTGKPAEECVVDGPDRTFRTYPVLANGLLDGRVYELVSPPDKNGGEVFPPSPETEQGGGCGYCLPGALSELMPMQSAPDGNSVVYEGQVFTATGEEPNENEYLATRTTTGWQTTDLSPQLEERDVGTNGYKAFSADLSVGILGQLRPSLSVEAPDGFFNLYVQGSGSPQVLSPLVGAAPEHRSPGAFSLGLVGESSDFSHIVFSANDALTGETPFAPAAEEAGGVYESVNGELRLVNVLPGNAASAPGTGDSVSGDGSRIYWTDTATKTVYMREGGDVTVEVPDPGAGFLAASGDGSTVLLSDGRLYGLQGGAFQQVVDLAEGQGGFQGLLGASEDFASVYFIDTSVLGGSKENARHEEAVSGGYNLYLHSNGVTQFVGTLSANDDGTGDIVGGLRTAAGDWHSSASARTAQVTADGRFAVFMSQAPLTGYDNTDEATGAPDYEVFEYDAASGDLACVSCGRPGVRPTGVSGLTLIDPARSPASASPPTSVLEDGRVFFDSFASLSPFDTNGHVEDVYEYEPDQVGSCESAGESGGCVALISSGLDTTDSQFVDATPSGSDVFFTTRSQLVPADRDTLMDLYDAREGGGVPAGVVTPPCSTTDSCRTAPVPQPDIFGAPSSQTFTGAGNPPVSGPAVVVVSKGLSRARKLANALSVCRKQKVRRKRTVCEGRARKRYATTAGTKTTAKTKAKIKVKAEAEAEGTSRASRGAGGFGGLVSGGRGE